MPYFCLVLMFAGAPESDQPPDLRCGSYSLYISLKALEFPVGSFDEIEEKLGQPTLAGYSLGQLDEVARSYGAHTLGVQTTIENLQRRSGRFACIARFDGTHFVNIAQIGEKTAYIIDAPRKDHTLPLDALRTRWDGKALLISNEPLVPEDALQGRSHLWAVSALVGAGGALFVGIGFFVTRNLRTQMN